MIRPVNLQGRPAGTHDVQQLAISLSATGSPASTGVLGRSSNRYAVSRIVVGNQTITGMGVRLVAGFRTPAVFDIEGNVTGAGLSRVAVSAGSPDGGFFQIVLKDIPIR